MKVQTHFTSIPSSKASLGDWVAFELAGDTGLGLVVQPPEEGDEPDLLVLKHPVVAEHGYYLLRHRSLGSRLLVFTDAVVRLRDDLNDIHLTADSPPAGAIIILGNDDFGVVVPGERPIERKKMFSVTSGTFLGAPPNQPWFSRWTVGRQQPDHSFLSIAEISARAS